MIEIYKSRVVQSLSEILPPFADSVIGLMDYLKDEKEFNVDLLLKLAEILVFSKKLLDSLSNELESIQKDLIIHRQSVSEENEMIRYQEAIENIRSIKLLSHVALKQIGEGVATLLYLMADEKKFIEDMKKKGFYEKIFANLENPNIDTAVDNLYQGSKKLTEIIDKVIDD